MGCGGDNCPANFSEIGMYEFAVDATDYQAPQIIDTKLVESYAGKDWYIPGTIVGGWNHDVANLMAFSQDDGLVSIESAELTAGTTYEFKFTCGDWGQCEHGASAVTVAEGSLPIGGDNNITFTAPADGRYVINFDFLQKTVSIEAL
ncbi:hypothetical protein JCM19236_2517 [Vibrio sp. JCM 19236]|nr:hypothetical protein JCM19236_2517 [Vibrio sp. JCM 19236]